MTPAPQRARRQLLVAAAGSLLLPGCSALGALDAFVPRDSYEGRAGLRYGTLPRQQLDAYLPLQRSSATPLVVFFYGGSWTTGDRGDYRFVGEALASQGVAALVADYRLSPAVRWAEILGDCAQATAWARNNAAQLGCSRERLFVMGHSAGAYNAAMVALDGRWLQRHAMQPRELAGWIGIAGPYDFLPISDAASRVAFDWPNTPADSQPIVHASRDDPRALLLAPVDDRTVDPRRNTLGLAQKLRDAGVPVRAQLLEGVNHATIIGALARPLSNLAPVRQEVLGFVSG